jgi:lipoate-protein ligase A
MQLADARAIDVRRIGMPLPPDSAYVAPIVGEGIALGRFQRARSTLELQQLEGSGLSLVRRKTGGGALRLGRGQVYVAFELASAGIDPSRILNRNVRPLLRALTSLSHIAVTSGGREVMLARGEPIGWVGVHHERESGATGLEAVVNVTRTFELDAAVDLSRTAIEPRFKTPRTLEEMLDRRVTEEEVVAAIVRELGADEWFTADAPISRVDMDEAPFTAMIEESIGLIGTIKEPDRIVIGGDLMASHDAIEALGRAVLHAEDVGTTINQQLDGAMVLGVRSLESLRKVIEAVK